MITLSLGENLAKNHLFSCSFNYAFSFGSFAKITFTKFNSILLYHIYNVQCAWLREDTHKKVGFLVVGPLRLGTPPPDLSGSYFFVNFLLSGLSAVTTRQRRGGGLQGGSPPYTDFFLILSKISSFSEPFFWILLTIIHCILFIHIYTLSSFLQTSIFKNALFSCISFHF